MELCPKLWFIKSWRRLLMKGTGGKANDLPQKLCFKGKPNLETSH
jgi:hypothetical protein